MAVHPQTPRPLTVTNWAPVLSVALESLTAGPRGLGAGRGSTQDVCEGPDHWIQGPSDTQVVSAVYPLTTSAIVPSSFAHLGSF